MTFTLQLRTAWKKPAEYRFDVVVEGSTRVAWNFDPDQSYQSKEHHVYRASLPDGRLFCEEHDTDQFEKRVLTVDELNDLMDVGQSWYEVEAIFEDMPYWTEQLLGLIGGAA